MADMFDYLNWRGDVPFSADPFNEVDGLILAELAYTNFENEFPANASISVQDVRDAFFARHTREELLESSSWSAKAALFLEEMSEGARYRGTRLCGYINEIDREKDAQIAAVTFLLDDGTAFVAFRGTDGSLVGWKEDFDLSYLTATEGQRRAVVYMNEAGRSINRPLRTGGHSKGGNFAVYAAAFCAPEISERILSVYSYDGPGFRREIVDSDEYMRILPRVCSIVPDTSIIGRLLASKCEHRVVESRNTGIAQHDGFSWELLRNRFVEALPTETGRMIEAAMGDWLEQTDDETLRSFTETIFTLFEATGQETFSDMGARKLKSAEAMLAGMADLPKEKRRELRTLLKRLVASGGSMAAAHLPGRQGRLQAEESDAGRL